MRSFRYVSALIAILLVASAVGAGNWPGCAARRAWVTRTRKTCLWNGTARPRKTCSGSAAGRDRQLQPDRLGRPRFRHGVQEADQQGAGRQDDPGTLGHMLPGADGKELWRTPVPPGHYPRGYGIYAVPTPVTDGKLVFCWFSSGVFAALDFDGKIIWRKEMLRRIAQAFRRAHQQSAAVRGYGDPHRQCRTRTAATGSCRPWRK